MNCVINWVHTSIEVPNNPIAPPPPKWEIQDEVPILLDYNPDKKTWYIIATFYMCDVWVKWGKPALPYRQYEVQNNAWVALPLDNALIGKPTNLVASVASKKIGSRVTLEDKVKLNWNAGKGYKIITTGWRSCSNYR